MSDAGMKPHSRPNFVVFMSDQQRFDTIGALGNPHVHTPNLDRMVRQGIAFTHTYCQHPICQPSRASFMTGRYPNAVGVGFNGAERLPEAAQATLWSRLLAESGYDCGLVGKLHLSACKGRREPRVRDGFRSFQWAHTPHSHFSPGESDYMEWLRSQGQDPNRLMRAGAKRLDRSHVPTMDQDNISEKYHFTTWCANEAVAFIEESGEDPWLLCVNTFDPHTPFDPPWEYFRRFSLEDMPDPHFRETDLRHQKWLEDAGIPFQTSATDPTSFDIRSITVCYYAMIELLDQQLGRIFKAIERKGFGDGTVFVFTSDHGEMLGDHGLLRKGCRFYEGAVRVPHIWHAPGLVNKEGAVDALVELMDIGPTILDLAGCTVPDLMQGKSMRALLTGPEGIPHHRSFVRSEYFSADSARPRGIMYRDDTWKLITYHGEGEAGTVGELYNLKEDPWEFENLWQDPAFRVTRSELVERSFHATVLSMDPGAPRISSH